MLCILYIVSVPLKWCHVVIWGGMGYHDLEISEQQWHCQRMTGWISWGVTRVISAYGFRCHSLCGCCHCAWLLMFVFVTVSSFCSRMLVHVSQHPLVLSRQVVTSVALRVLHWPWTTGGGTQPIRAPGIFFQTGYATAPMVHWVWIPDKRQSSLGGWQPIPGYSQHIKL